MEWLNPALSGEQYNTITSLKGGEYIEFVWDDVLHDVWKFDSAATYQACDFSGATKLYERVHHSYEVPTGFETDGRAVWQIPK